MWVMSEFVYYLLTFDFKTETKNDMFTFNEPANSPTRPAESVFLYQKQKLQTKQ